MKLESNFPVQEQIDKTHTDFDRMSPFNAVLRITDNRFWAKKIIQKARQNSCCCLLLSLLKISVCATAMQGSLKCFLDSVAVEREVSDNNFWLLKWLTFRGKKFLNLPGLT